MMAARDLSFDPSFAAPAEWASMYRTAGLQVVPCFMPHERPTWKCPKLSTWTELRENRVPEATFARWYGPNGDNAKRPNMGLIAGPASENIVVIDLDTHKKPEADEWWTGLLAVNNYGDEPETWKQTTGGGGRQIMFRARPDWQAPTNKTGIGVDIRGYGGFAVLPPSKHDSGREYEWEAGCAPYETDIEDAPEWLLAGIDELVARFGGDTTDRPRVERVATSGDYDAWGHLKDGREDYMTRLVWATVLNLRRDAPFVPSQAEQTAAMDEAFETYLRNVTTNHHGELEAGLEKEGRGQTLFAQKWQRAMKQWDGKVAEMASLPAPARLQTPETDVAAIHKAFDALEAAEGLLDKETTPEISTGISATPFAWIDPTSIPPRAWVYGRHYIRKFISTTVAPGGVGKTALSVVEALSITSGRPLLGVTPDDRTRVWLWNGEDPLEELQRRVMAAALHHGMAKDDVVGRLFVDTGRDTPIVIAERTRDGATINAPVIAEVIKTITDNKIGVVIIDPFVACHRVTENDNSEIERVAKAWAYIADVTNCSVELVHHVRKTNGNEVGVEDGRGATALLAAARSARALNRMTADEAARVGIQDPGFYFRADNGKANLAPPSGSAAWFYLASVDLDNETAMTATAPARPSDQVGVVTHWEWPDPTSDVTPSDMHAVRSVVMAGKYRADPQAAEWVGKAIAEAIGFDLDIAGTAKAKALQAMWTKSGALKEVDGPDERRKVRRFVTAGNFNE